MVSWIKLQIEENVGNTSGFGGLSICQKNRRLRGMFARTHHPSPWLLDGEMELVRQKFSFGLRIMMFCRIWKDIREKSKDIK
jgi:hypothetical protein